MKHRRCHQQSRRRAALHHVAGCEIATDTVRRFVQCLDDVDAWMKASRLLLNPHKTQLTWFGSRQQLDKLLSATIRPQSTVRDLGAILDSQLTMADQVRSLCRSGYYQLRQLSSGTQSLTQMLSQYLFTHISATRLHCNVICCMHGVADQHFKRCSRRRTLLPGW